MHGDGLFIPTNMPAQTGAWPSEKVSSSGELKADALRNMFVKAVALETFQSSG